MKFSMFFPTVGLELFDFEIKKSFNHTLELDENRKHIASFGHWIRPRKLRKVVNK